ncbi:MAG: hypothetical protein ACWA5L_10945 [bacterium]
MIRLSTIFFCLLLAAAAAGRYQAEASVRADKKEMHRIEQKIEAEKQVINQLQMEVEVLESGARLAALTQQYLELEAVKPRQLHRLDDFARIAGIASPQTPEPSYDEQADFIVNAIAMADFGTAP